MKTFRGLKYILVPALLFWCLAILLSNVQASEVSLSLTQKSMNNADDSFSTNYWAGFQLSYQPDNTDTYFFLSKEKADVAPIYSAYKYTMTGIGIGTKYPLTKRLRMVAQVGYYFIKNSWGGRKRQFNEGLYYYFNRRFNGSQGGGYHLFKDYSVENDNAIGATIGLELLHPINKQWSVGFLATYRMMKIKEDINAYAYLGELGHWQHAPTRDYSSTNVGLSLNYAF